MKLIQCKPGPTSTVVAGQEYVFALDAFNRAVSVVDNLHHRAVLLSVEHYIEVPEEPDHVTAQRWALENVPPVPGVNATAAEPEPAPAPEPVPAPVPEPAPEQAPGEPEPAPAPEPEAAPVPQALPKRSRGKKSS